MPQRRFHVVVAIVLMLCGAAIFWFFHRSEMSDGTVALAEKRGLTVPIPSDTRQSTQHVATPKLRDEKDTPPQPVLEKRSLSDLIADLKKSLQASERRRTTLVKRASDNTSDIYQFTIERASDDEESKFREEANRAPASLVEADAREYRIRSNALLGQYFDFSSPYKMLNILVPRDPAKYLMVMEGALDDPSLLILSDPKNINSRLHVKGKDRFNRMYQVDNAEGEWRYGALLKTQADK